VSDTSDNYEQLRPKKLLKAKPVRPECGQEASYSSPWNGGNSDDTPPWGIVIDSPSSSVSSLSISSPESIHPDQFWDVVKTQHPECLLDASGSSLPWAKQPSLPLTKLSVSSSGYQPVHGWGDDPWGDDTTCSCTGWCSCPSIALTGF
jgi:hypothetical protein